MNGEEGYEPGDTGDRKIEGEGVLNSRMQIVVF